MQEIFQVGPLLGDAATSGTVDLSDMFVPNTIPTTVSLAGDYNHNGVVDAADYVLWRNGLGTTYSQADYDVWHSNFGQTASGAGSSGGRADAAVPEPATLELLIFAAAGWCVPRRAE
jgi:hypothetical protein